VVHQELEALLALQERDLAVMAADGAMQALEPELRVLDEQLAQVERELAAAQRAMETAAVRRETLEGKIANYRTMQEQRRQRLEWVRGAKEASTLMAELDLTRSVLAKEEAEFLRSGDAVVEAELQAKEVESRVEELRRQQAPQREVIAAKREELAAGRERALLERARAAAAVGARALARYERIRKGKAPLALYALHGDACGHCFTAVPVQRRALIQRGATVEGCEACGVLLYARP
jgi:predicted  nucleic acid-binding Zn-ribbon protein